MKSILQILLILIALIATPVMAGISDGWERLGKEKVHTRMERDEMRLASKGFIKQLALEVQGSAVFFESVQVHLANGEVLDMPIRSLLRAGERSRVMDLPGEARIIKKVVFIHRKTKHASHAEVVLWGRK